MGFEPEDLEDGDKRAQAPPKKHKYVEMDPIEELNAWALQEGILDPEGQLTDEQRKSLTTFLASRIQEEL